MVLQFVCRINLLSAQDELRRIKYERKCANIFEKLTIRLWESRIQREQNGKKWLFRCCSLQFSDVYYFVVDRPAMPHDSEQWVLVWCTTFWWVSYDYLIWSLFDVHTPFPRLISPHWTVIELHKANTMFKRWSSGWFIASTFPAAFRFASVKITFSLFQLLHLLKFQVYFSSSSYYSCTFFYRLCLCSFFRRLRYNRSLINRFGVVVCSCARFVVSANTSKSHKQHQIYRPYARSRNGRRFLFFLRGSSDMQHLSIECWNDCCSTISPYFSFWISSMFVAPSCVAFDCDDGSKYGLVKR